MGQGEKAKQVFAKELAQITNPEIRDFTIECFEKLGHEWFWNRPCALSGRFHPQIAQGPGGLVRHVKYGVWWGIEMARALFGTGKDSDPCPYMDEVISALLLHDLLKDGDPMLAGRAERAGPQGKKLILGCHGVDMANAILNRVLAGRQPNTSHILIMYGIAAHMGVWTLPVEYKPLAIKGDLARMFALCVHLSDYAASRKADDGMREIAGFVP